MKQIFCLFAILCFVGHSAPVQAQHVATSLSGQNYLIMTLEEYNLYKLQHSNIKEQAYFGQVKAEQIPALVAQLNATGQVGDTEKRTSINTDDKNEKSLESPSPIGDEGQQQLEALSHKSEAKLGSFNLNGMNGGGDSGKAIAAILLVAMALVIVVGGVLYISNAIARMNVEEIKKEMGYMAYTGGEFYHYSPDDSELQEDPTLKSESGRVAYGGVAFLPSLKKTSFGILLEGGNINGTFMKEGGSGVAHINGDYLAVGGILNSVHSSGQFIVSFLGGTSRDSGIDLIMIGRAGYLIGRQDGFRLGVTIGALGLSLDSKVGLARKGLPVNLVLGLQMGYIF